MYETTGQTIKEGRNAVASNTIAAHNVLGELGLPSSLMYFSMNYDMQPSEYALLDVYLDGIASIISKDCMGMYGATIRAST